jgi:hypothetical protein
MVVELEPDLVDAEPEAAEVLEEADCWDEDPDVAAKLDSGSG